MRMLSDEAGIQRERRQLRFPLGFRAWLSSNKCTTYTHTEIWEDTGNDETVEARIEKQSNQERIRKNFNYKDEINLTNKSIAAILVIQRVIKFEEHESELLHKSSIDAIIIVVIFLIRLLFIFVLIFI